MKEIRQKGKQTKLQPFELLSYRYIYIYHRFPTLTTSAVINIHYIPWINSCTRSAVSLNSRQVNAPIFPSGFWLRDLDQTHGLVYKYALEHHKLLKIWHQSTYLPSRRETKHRNMGLPERIDTILNWHWTELNMTDRYSISNAPSTKEIIINRVIQAHQLITTLPNAPTLLQ